MNDTEACKAKTFHATWVTLLGSQSHTERFGEKAEPFFAQWQRTGEQEDIAEEMRRKSAFIMPQIELYKNNLTVLSQRYNLYFAGYGEDIHIYRPHGPGQLLSRDPALILKLHLECQSRHDQHVLNHVIIGDLGSQEILLCSCHNGDVIGFHTNAIENALRIGSKVPKPFFFENVGISAWGLAIHKESRMIAISSNLHEVTVFAFGLNPSPDVEYQTHASVEPVPMEPTSSAISDKFLSVAHVDDQSDYNWSPYVHHDIEKLLVCSKCSRGWASHQRKQFIEHFSNHVERHAKCVTRDTIPKDKDGNIDRSESFKFVISLYPQGNNIPSIAFSDDENGGAKSIVAKDINGTIWIMPLQQDVLVSLQTYEISKQGWGVLVLPTNFFSPTRTYQETFGHSKVFISRADLNGFSDQIELSTGLPTVIDGHHNVSISEGLESYCLRTGLEITEFKNEEERIREIVFESFQERSIPPVVRRSKAILDFFGTSLLLHTDRENVGLLSYNSPSTICAKLVQDRIMIRAANARFDYNGLNILAAIPALSLVVVASQRGRVALLTITRYAPVPDELSNFVSFRVERTLPRLELNADGLLDVAGDGILGVAVGPMQGELERRKRSQKELYEPWRYRLMLHYYDHSIKAYELSRRHVTQDLKVEDM